MARADQLKTPVVIVGGGPVGLVLALLLDFHGVKSTIINTVPTERWHPKGNGQNARTMEIYRQLGFSDQGIAKICRRHAIPTPPQGHWTLVQMGRPVSTIPLPASDQDGPDRIEIFRTASRLPKAAAQALQALETERRNLNAQAELSPEARRDRTPFDRVDNPRKCLRATAAALRRANVNTDDSNVVGTLPRVSFSRGEKRLGSLPIYFGAASEFATLIRKDKLGDRINDRRLTRIDIYPGLRFPFTKWPYLTFNTQVAFRETVSKSAYVDYTHKKQTGVSGQFARVKMTIEPNEQGKGYEFENKVVGGNVPKEYIPGVQKGVQSVVESGVLAGFPMLDVKVTLTDGAYHDVDSSVMAFEIAGRAAFREGALKAGPKLLEPIMKVEVVTPEEYVGGIIGDLTSRRGQVRGQESRGNAAVINAMVPLANMFGYINTLRSMSQGRAQYSMQFDHYEQVPQAIADEVKAKYA